MVSPGVAMRCRVAGSGGGWGVRINSILSGVFRIFIIVYVNLLRPETSPIPGQETATAVREYRGHPHLRPSDGQPRRRSER